MKDVLDQIERGLQRGKRFDQLIEGKQYYSQVAIQKKGDIYIVYTFTIEESLMDTPEDVDGEIVVFKTLSDALEYIYNRTGVSVADLEPCKGSRIFEPEWFDD